MTKPMVLMKLVALLMVVAVAHGFDFGDLAKKTSDVAKVAVKTTKTLVEKAPEIFSPDQLLEFSKQSIAGVPLEALAATINKICKIF